MLALSRRTGEEILLFHNTEVCSIKIGRVSPTRVQLLFDAPRAFDVLRRELVTKCEHANHERKGVPSHASS